MKRTKIPIDYENHRKWCNKCSNFKPLEEFYKTNASNTKNYSTYCKFHENESCKARRLQKTDKEKQDIKKRNAINYTKLADVYKRRSRASYYQKLDNGLTKGQEQNIKSKFNISGEEYIQMVKQQNNKCAICEEEEKMTFKGRIKSLCIDHDHKTGKIRALLCSRCNAGLGCYDDNTNKMKKAIEYLEKFKNKEEN